MLKYILFFAAMLAAFAIWLINGSIQQKKRLIERLKREFGEVVHKDYDFEHFQCIPHYFEHHKDKGFYIDDITWNDLDMDRVFMLINNTQSSAGEEYLYKALRMPEFDREKLEERERIVRLLSDNEELRLELQKSFRQMGYTRRISLADYIESFIDLETKKAASQYIYTLFVIISAAVMAWQVSVGMVLLVLVLIYNVNAYFKEKATVESYFNCAAYICGLVKTCHKLNLKCDELRDYEEELSRRSDELMPIVKKTVFMGNAKNVSDGLAESILQYINMVFHLDLISFYSILGTVKEHIADIDRMLEIVGQLETAIAVASFRKTLPYWCNPVFVDDAKKYLDITDIYHPLLKQPVANCIEESRSVLLTGSNASGKSTFLKTVAINAILAQTINTCPAHSVKTGFYRVISSMALKDSIETGDSYYMVEIKALKRIMDAAKTHGEAPVMCFVDEVLRGTNTVERIAASSRILLSLSGDGAFVFAATHDIELTHLLEKEYANYHFREEVKDNDISFNYVLNKGRAATRNAIKLLGIMGYDESVIKKAESTAEHFIETGQWRL